MKADEPAGRPRRPAQKPRLRRRFNTWLLQHAEALVGSLGQYLRYPAGNLLTTAVIGIALALPAGFYLLLDNARAVQALGRPAADHPVPTQRDRRGQGGRPQ